MAVEIVEPRMRGFICTTAHPAGCAEHVGHQVAIARRDPATWTGGKLLVVGASTGYGLASRVVGTFGHGMDSVGVFFERPASGRRTASAGWYNAAAFHRLAHEAGLRTGSLNGDAFSTPVLQETVQKVADELGPLDVFVYSLASPVRVDPDTGETYRSVLKTIGQPITAKTVDIGSGEVTEVTIDAATEAEIAATVAVMGGADLARWVNALLEARLFAPGARVVAYSYIGPKIIWPMYTSGTIGRAKAHLEATCRELNPKMAAAVGGSCRVTICKSIVSQAGAAIPVVPLYMSLIFRIMKEAGIHEGPVEQMLRLFGDHIGQGCTATLDEEGRIRLDNLELQPDVQAELMARWPRVTTENLNQLADFAGFRRYFYQLFGFEFPGVDYNVPVETEVLL